jgi:manganese/zinc/iron transport system permease protein
MILNIVFYYFIIFALTQGISLGLVSSYMVVKRWSMLGDIMSHAALPGIVVAFFLTHSTSLLVLIGGGLVSALLSALCSFLLQRKGNFPRESNFALILSWFFSFGIIMMNVIQKQSIPGQSILNSFIFGNILMINHTDVIYYVIYTVLFSFFMIFFSRKKEFFAFDTCFFFYSVSICLFMGNNFFSFEYVNYYYCVAKRWYIAHRRIDDIAWKLCKIN